ncbi:MAG: hypothetical protein VXV96_05735 [Bdellovibrionota bacterium]|nr:hypothetical protein [Bdellovibrionota bacterium]
MKTRLIFVFFLFFIHDFAHAENYVIKRGESLSHLWHQTTGRPGEGHESFRFFLNRILKLNPHLGDGNLIHPGEVVALTAQRSPLILRKPAQEHRETWQAAIEALSLFTAVRGTSLRSGSRLQLISESHRRLKGSVKAQFGKNLILARLNVDQLRFQEPNGGGLSQRQFSLKRGEVQIGRELNDFLKLLLGVSAGDSLLQRSSQSDLRLYKGQTMKIEGGVKMEKKMGDSSLLKAQLMGGQSFYNADQEVQAKGRGHWNTQFSLQRNFNSFALEVGVGFEKNIYQTNEFRVKEQSSLLFVGLKYNF